MRKIIAHKKAPLPENKEAKRQRQEGGELCRLYFIIVSAMPNKFGRTMKSAKNARIRTMATV